MCPPPTIVGTLADGTVSLRIEGLVATVGDTVWIDQSSVVDFSSLIDRDIVFVSAHTQDFTLAVGLAGGTFVRALQMSGGVLSAPSRVREVHGAVQPFPEPRPPLYVDAAAEGLTVESALPGCPVVLEVGGVEMTRATADGDGVARIALPYSLLGVPPGSRVQARVEVRWAAGPLALGMRVVNRDLSDPKWTLPKVDLGPFGGQTAIVVSSLVPGTRLVVSAEGAAGVLWLADVIAYSSRERVVLPRPLIEGETLVLLQRYSGLTRYGEAPPEATARLVVQANTLAPPLTVVGPVLVGDTSLMIRGMVEGATVQVVDIASLTLMLERPAGASDVVDLAVPITGDIQVFQLLSGAFTSTSAAAEIVSPAPLPTMPIPFLVPPANADGRAAVVMSVEPGARVAIRRASDEALLGEAWVRMGDTAALVPIVPPTQSGDLLFPTAIRGEKGAKGAPVPAIEPVAVSPHLDGPIAWGATSVLVVGLTPGATVRIQSFGMYGFRSLGQVDAAEPIVRVPIDAAPFGLVWARTEIQGQVRRSGLVLSVPAPGAAGPYSTKEQFYAAGEAGAVPGQLYYPTDAATGYPLFTVVDDLGLPVHAGTLVVIQHGDPPYPTEGTYLGYAYLAKHLASWGMVVFSIDVGAGPVDTTGVHVLSALGAWKASPAPQVDAFPVPIGWFENVGLIGHSRGGAAVHNAALNDSVSSAPFGIGAVIAFGADGTSVTALPALPWPGAPAFLNVVGSMDNVALENEVLTLHESLVRPATLLWVHRAYHNPWNTIWAELDDVAPEPTAKPVGSLTDADHKMIAKALVTAFLVGHLWNWKVYLGFVDGRVWPEGLAKYKIVADYRSGTGPETRDGYLVGGPLVIDNFGDANAQLFPRLAENVPPGVGDVSTNSLGHPFTLTGPGLTGGTVETPGPDIDFGPGGQAIPIAWSTTEDLSLTQTISDETGGPDLSGVTVRIYLSLRLARRLELVHAAKHVFGTPWVPPGPPADWLVRLSDGSSEAYVRLGALGPVPYPDILDASTEAAPVPGEAAGQEPSQDEVRGTWRIEMSAFVAACPMLNLRALTELSVAHPSPEAAAGCWIDDMEIVS